MTTTGYRHPRFTTIDRSLFEGDNAPFGMGSKPKHGQPTTVTFCRSCVISNQMPMPTGNFLPFDDRGVCRSCRIMEQKRQGVDWHERERELFALCDRSRRTDGAYDCLVPGSGGKDSFFAAHILKNKYGMHPLTVTWAPHLFTDWGWRNHQALGEAGLDNYLVTPNRRVHRLLTRLALETLFDPDQPFLLGRNHQALRLAASLDIRLVFFADDEHEYGNPQQDLHILQPASAGLEDSEGIRLGGLTVEELIHDYDIDRADLNAYLPLSPETLESFGTQVHHLGYYLKWQPQHCYFYAVEHGGFEAAPERSPGTYGKFSSIDNRLDDLFFYTAFVKYGIGRASYDAARDIRTGELTRDAGIALVHRFDGEYPLRFEDETFRYLSLPPDRFPKAARHFEEPLMDRAYFLHLADRFRPPHLWRWTGEDWELRRTV